MTLRPFRHAGVAALVLMGTALAGWAHDLGVARVELQQLSDTSFRLSTSIPLEESIMPPRFPERFDVLSARIPPEQQPTKMTQSWVALSTTEPLTTQESIILPWPRDGAFVNASWLDGTEVTRFFPLTDEGTRIEVGLLGGAPPPLLSSMWRYVVLGVEHILAGWDHLAFVLSLCLLQRGWALVRLVTAFTVGHSFTLIAAVVGWIQVPGPPVEACIALSIVMVAWKSIRQTSEFAHGYSIVFAFGLLHGLGFAGALTEIGMPRAERLVGLLSFNIGVELGQVAFVAAITGAVWGGRWILQKLQREPSSFLQPIVAAGLVIIGSYWTVDRIVQF